MQTSTVLSRRTLLFTLYTAVWVAVFWSPLRQLIHLSLSSETCSYVLFIPILSIGLLFIARERIFARPRCSAGWASVLFLLGILASALSWRFGPFLSNGDSVGLSILGLLCVVWSGFLFFYGSRVFVAGLFPLLFLLLMVPVPGVVLERVIHWLQVCSAEVAYWVFQFSGTPVLRQGLLFTVPGVTIEVAKECSGIRSTLALLITCLLAGYLLLRTRWARILLVLSTLPVLIIKNGVRIATLTLLAVRVDPGFLTGSLHRRGGFLFFTLGLLILLPVLKGLQAVETFMETRAHGKASPPDTHDCVPRLHDSPDGRFYDGAEARFPN